MAGRPGLDPTEEGKSYSALFVLMVAVLLVSAVWSIWDDNISRRPWKDYQVKWDRLAYDRYMKDADEEQKRLNADPEYQKASKELAAAQKELDSGATAAKLADLRAQLVDLKVAADDKDQMVRFTKSFLTERWYDYNHAVQEKEDPAPYKNEIDKLNAELAQENVVSDAAKAKYQAVKDQIDALNSKVESLTEQMKKLTTKRDDFFDKADTYMIPVKLRNTVLFRYPKIPKIQQTSIDDFDRNAFDQAVARVDRCQSCHMGIDKKGFENAPEPFRTHPNFEQVILKHRSAPCGWRMATISIGISRCSRATRCSRDASSVISTSRRCAMLVVSRLRRTGSKASACSSRWDAMDATCSQASRRCRR